MILMFNTATFQKLTLFIICIMYSTCVVGSTYLTQIIRWTDLHDI